MYLMNPIEYKLAITVALTRFQRLTLYYNIIFVWIEHISFLELQTHKSFNVVEVRSKRTLG